MPVLGNEDVCAAGGHVDDQAADDGEGVGVVLEVRQHVHDRVPDFAVDRLASSATKKGEVSLSIH